jgi:PTH1 family peptidyl-tRNA hydrolase
MVLDALAREKNMDFRQKKSDGAEYEFADFRADGDTVICIKPLTFMNRSGMAIAPFLKFYQIPVDGLIVVHDDLDLPLGRLKFAAGGGHGGHNGIKSVMSSLGTRGFGRLKIGIGRPENSMPVERYVLSSFGTEELTVLQDVIAKAVMGVDAWVTDGMERTMNFFNRRE